MMFKQMLVHKLFVMRSDASRFTAAIYYSLFGCYVVIIGTLLPPYQLQHEFCVYEYLLYSCYSDTDTLKKRKFSFLRNIHYLYLVKFPMVVPG